MNYKFDSPAIFLIGPSAVGKTTLSLKISQNFPVEIISVDSAMVFQKMDIGTCKPSNEEQKSDNNEQNGEKDECKDSFEDFSNNFET